MKHTLDILLRHGRARQFSREERDEIERRIYLSVAPIRSGGSGGLVYDGTDWIPGDAMRPKISVEANFRFIATRYRDLAALNLWHAKRFRSFGDLARAKTYVATARTHLQEARQFRRLLRLYRRLDVPKPEPPADLDLLVEKGIARREDYAERPRYPPVDETWRQWGDQ